MSSNNSIGGEYMTNGKTKQQQVKEREVDLSAVITKEGNEYVAVCPELDVASQGDNIEDALAMLKEAVELYVEEKKDRIC